MVIAIGLCMKIVRRNDLDKFEIGAVGSLCAIGLCALFFLSVSHLFGVDQQRLFPGNTF